MSRKKSTPQQAKKNSNPIGFTSAGSRTARLWRSLVSVLLFLRGAESSDKGTADKLDKPKKPQSGPDSVRKRSYECYKQSNPLVALEITNKNAPLTVSVYEETSERVGGQRDTQTA